MALRVAILLLLLLPVRPAAGDFLTAVNQNAGDDASGAAEATWEDQRALYLRGGVAQWTAIFGDNFGTTFGGTLGYAYGWKPNVVVRVGTGFYHFRSDELAGARPTARARVTIFPLLAGADYLFSSGNIRPFVGGAAGPVMLKAVFLDRAPSRFRFADLIDGWLGVQGRAGVTVLRPGSNLGFEVQAAYNAIIDKLEEFSMGDPSHHDFFELSGGVTYFLGGGY